MKRIYFISIFLIFTTLATLGQYPNKIKSNPSQQEIIRRLEKGITQKWIRQNPKLNNTQSSFFNKDNEKKYFIGLLELGGGNIPFAWDDNFSLIKFILNLDSDIVIKQGILADKFYKGTKITWKKNINALICVNQKTFKATVENWQLLGVNDCPGTINFPALSLQTMIAIPKQTKNCINGLTILPYDASFVIKRIETTLTNENGKAIKGIGYDLNNDDIVDIFSYDEGISDTASYIRLYINVNGQWKCKWIHLDEECTD